MKLFKPALAAAALSFFVLACNNDTQTNQTANTNTRPSATATPAPSATAAAAPDEFADARTTYKNACIRCHKPDGTGGPFQLEDGSTLKVPSLREGHALKHTDAQMVKQIQNGGEGMPAFKNKLDADKINALVRFIRHDFQGQTAPGVAPSPSR